MVVRLRNVQIRVFLTFLTAKPMFLYCLYWRLVFFIYLILSSFFVHIIIFVMSILWFKEECDRSFLLVYGGILYYITQTARFPANEPLVVC